MFKSKKKITILILLVLCLFSVIYIFFKSKNSETQTQKNINQTIDIPNYFKGADLSIENNIKTSDFKFPSSMPYLEQSNDGELTTAAAKNIAINLGFTTEPTVANDTQNGTIMIWNSDKYSLMITLKTNHVQYSSNNGIHTLIQNSINKQISDKEYQDISTNFLTNKMSFDSQKLNFMGLTYYKTANNTEYLAKTTKDNADVIQVNCSQSPVNYPVFTTNPDKPQIFLQLLKDGTIINFEANIGISFKESASKYPILNYDQFSKNLSQSIVVSLNNNSVNLPDLKSNNITNTKVNSVSLVYLLNNTETTYLQPVFLINGTSSVTGIEGPVNIVMYLPALEGSSTPEP